MIYFIISYKKALSLKVLINNLKKERSLFSNMI